MLDRKKIFFGILIVLGIAITWVLITQINKHLQVKSKLEAPYFIVWWEANFYLLFIFYPLLTRSNIPLKLSEDNLTVKKLFKFGLLFYLLWVGANYFFMRSLSMISSSDVTAVFSATPAFVFILSVLLIKEKVNFIKIIAVGSTIAGVVSVAAAEKELGKNINVFAYFLVLVSAVCSALYQTLLKKLLGNISFFTSVMLFIAIAIVNLSVFWSLVLLLHFIDFERVHINKEILLQLFLTGISSVFFNGFINFGIVYTYPLFISLGIILGIPLNVFADFVINNLKQPWLKILGCGLIVAGFVLFILNNMFFEKEKTVQNEQKLLNEDKETEKDESLVK